MRLIWATGGRKWGFRFLLDGGFSDPLETYERAFAGLEDETEVFRRVGNRVALRFLDPLGRRDTAGRVIPHDFVVMGALAASVGSVEDGLEHVWPLVVDVYAEVWQSDKPPTIESIRSAVAADRPQG